MMESRNKLLSLAIAAVLAGCSSAPEKPSNDAATEPVKSASQQVVAKSVEKNESAPVVSESVATPPVEEKAAPFVAAPEPVPVPVAPAPAPAHEVAPVAAAPEPKTVHKVPTDPNTFLITAETKDKTHPYYGQGQGVGFAVNGVQGKDLSVVRGEKYKFDVDTGVQRFLSDDFASGLGKRYLQ